MRSFSSRVSYLVIEGVSLDSLFITNEDVSSVSELRTLCKALFTEVLLSEDEETGDPLCFDSSST